MVSVATYSLHRLLLSVSGRHLAQCCIASELCDRWSLLIHLMTRAEFYQLL